MMSNITNITDFMSLIAYSNTVTDGWMMMAFLGGTFLISAAVGLRFGKTIALVAASFITALLSFVLSFAGLVDYVWFFVASLLLVVSIIIHYILK